MFSPNELLTHLQASKHFEEDPAGSRKILKKPQKKNQKKKQSRGGIKILVVLESLSVDGGGG